MVKEGEEEGATVGREREREVERQECRTERRDFECWNDDRKASRVA